MILMKELKLHSFKKKARRTAAKSISEKFPSQFNDWGRKDQLTTNSFEIMLKQITPITYSAIVSRYR